MATRDQGDPLADGFLSRWSRLKQERREEEPETAPAVTENRGEAAAGPPSQTTAKGDDAPFDPEQLPDIDSLTSESDFTPFLREGVPEALRRQALRRLWRLNPVFANLDGLNDYDQDFSDAATVIKGLKTLYQVGRGIGHPASDAPDDQERGDEGADPDGGIEKPTTASTGTESPARPEPSTVPALDRTSASSAGDVGEAERLAGAAQPARPQEVYSSVPTAPERTSEEPSEQSGAGQPAVGRQKGSAVRRRWGQFGEG